MTRDTTERLVRRRTAVANKAQLEMPDPLATMARTADPVPMVLLVDLALMLHLVPPSCQPQINALAPLHQVIVDPKARLDHLAKADPRAPLAPMELNHHPAHLVHQVLMDRMANQVPKVHLVRWASRPRALRDQKDHLAHPEQLDNQVPAANQVPMANLAAKVHQALRAIAAQQEDLAIPVPRAVLVAPARKACPDRALNARRPVWHLDTRITTDHFTVVLYVFALIVNKSLAQVTDVG